MKWRYGKKSRAKLKIILAVLLLMVIAIAAVSFLPSKNRATKNKNEPVVAVKAAPTPKPEKRAKLMAVGDMLIHDTIYNDFRIAGSDTFDFKPGFSDIKPIIQKGDFNIVNEETILGGVELGLSGLYVANSPKELGDAFIDTGFNIIQLANNHAYDRGLLGMTNTLSFWANHKSDAITAGVYNSQQSRDTVPVIEKNGIKLAFLAYTFGSNLGNGPNGYNLNIINRDLMKVDVAKAKTQADVVVVGLHWGVENTRQPTSEQRSLAQFLADNGVDVIFGTHPHELQPPEWLTGADGHKTFVMYSLGNLLSIDTLDPPYTLTGAIMGLDIIKKADDSIALESPFTVLTWNYFSKAETGFKVMPFDTVTQNDYWWGNWANHKTETENFIRQNIPDLKLLGLSDFK